MPVHLSDWHVIRMPEREVLHPTPPPPAPPPAHLHHLKPTAVGVRFQPDNLVLPLNVLPLHLLRLVHLHRVRTAVLRVRDVAVLGQHDLAVA